MSSETPIVLRLELNGQCEPITGRLSDGFGSAVPFSGWLGLAAAIAKVADLLDGTEGGATEAP